MAPEWEFRHVGVVVRDLDKAVKYYESLGIASLRPESMLDSSSSRFVDYQSNGKPPVIVEKARIRTVQIGSFAVELIQPFAGETVYKAFLESHEEGAHHIAYSVDNLDQEAAKLVEKGARDILSAKLSTGGRFAYFDTSAPDRLIIELVQIPKT